MYVPMHTTTNHNPLRHSAKQPLRRGPFLELRWLKSDALAFSTATRTGNRVGVQLHPLVRTSRTLYSAPHEDPRPLHAAAGGIGCWPCR